jgi:hypothetical protein
MSELGPLHTVQFSLSAGNSREQTTSTLLGMPKIEQNLQRQGKYLENEDAYCSLLILQSIFRSKLVMFL